ncbi:unnamed protein product [Gordionus sp. m RMFG-2023]
MILIDRIKTLYSCIHIHIFLLLYIYSYNTENTPHQNHNYDLHLEVDSLNPSLKLKWYHPPFTKNSIYNLKMTTIKYNLPFLLLNQSVSHNNLSETNVQVIGDLRTDFYPVPGSKQAFSLLNSYFAPTFMKFYHTSHQIREKLVDSPNLTYIFDLIPTTLNSVFNYSNQLIFNETQWKIDSKHLIISSMTSFKDYGSWQGLAAYYQCLNDSWEIIVSLQLTRNKGEQLKSSLLTNILQHVSFLIEWWVPDVSLDHDHAQHQPTFHSFLYSKSLGHLNNEHNYPNSSISLTMFDNISKNDYKNDDTRHWKLNLSSLVPGQIYKMAVYPCYRKVCLKRTLPHTSSYTIIDDGKNSQTESHPSSFYDYPQSFSPFTFRTRPIAPTISSYNLTNDSNLLINWEPPLQPSLFDAFKITIPGRPPFIADTHLLSHNIDLTSFREKWNASENKIIVQTVSGFWDKMETKSSLKTAYIDIGKILNKINWPMAKPDNMTLDTITDNKRPSSDPLLIRDLSSTSFLVDWNGTTTQFYYPTSLFYFLNVSSDGKNLENRFFKNQETSYRLHELDACTKYIVNIDVYQNNSLTQAHSTSIYTPPFSVDSLTLGDPADVSSMAPASLTFFWIPSALHQLSYDKKKYSCSNSTYYELKIWYMNGQTTAVPIHIFKIPRNVRNYTILSVGSIFDSACSYNATLSTVFRSEMNETIKSLHDPYVTFAIAPIKPSNVTLFQIGPTSYRALLNQYFADSCPFTSNDTLYISIECNSNYSFLSSNPLFFKVFEFNIASHHVNESSLYANHPFTVDITDLRPGFRYELNIRSGVQVNQRIVYSPSHLKSFVIAPIPTSNNLYSINPSNLDSSNINPVLNIADPIYYPTCFPLSNTDFNYTTSLSCLYSQSRFDAESEIGPARLIDFSSLAEGNKDHYSCTDFDSLVTDVSQQESCLKNSSSLEVDHSFSDISLNWKIDQDDYMKGHPELKKQQSRIDRFLIVKQALFPTAPKSNVSHDHAVDTSTAIYGAFETEKFVFETVDTELYILIVNPSLYFSTNENRRIGALLPNFYNGLKYKISLYSVSHGYTNVLSFSQPTYIITTPICSSNLTVLKTTTDQVTFSIAQNVSGYFRYYRITLTPIDTSYSDSTNKFQSSRKIPRNPKSSSFRSEIKIISKHPSGILKVDVIRKLERNYTADKKNDPKLEFQKVVHSLISGSGYNAVLTVVASNGKIATCSQTSFNIKPQMVDSSRVVIDPSENSLVIKWLIPDSGHFEYFVVYIYPSPSTQKPTSIPVINPVSGYNRTHENRITGTMMYTVYSRTYNEYDSGYDIDDSAHETYQEAENEEVLEVRAKHLKSYTNYVIEIVTVSQAGLMSQPLVLKAKTLDSIPGRVTDLKITNVKPYELTLAWNPPNPLGGNILGYRIKIVQKKTGESEVVTYRFTSTHLYPLVLENLISPNTNYEINIQAETAKGDGPYLLNPLNVVTPIWAPPIPQSDASPIVIKSIRHLAEIFDIKHIGLSINNHFCGDNMNNYSIITTPLSNEIGFQNNNTLNQRGIRESLDTPPKNSKKDLTPLGLLAYLIAFDFVNISEVCSKSGVHGNDLTSSWKDMSRGPTFLIAFKHPLLKPHGFSQIHGPIIDIAVLLRFQSFPSQINDSNVTTSSGFEYRLNSIGDLTRYLKNNGRIYGFKDRTKRKIISLSSVIKSYDKVSPKVISRDEPYYSFKSAETIWIFYVIGPYSRCNSSSYSILATNHTDYRKLNTLSRSRDSDVTSHEKFDNEFDCDGLPPYMIPDNHDVDSDDELVFEYRFKLRAFTTPDLYTDTVYSDPILFTPRDIPTKKASEIKKQELLLSAVKYSSPVNQVNARQSITITVIVSTIAGILILISVGLTYIALKKWDINELSFKTNFISNSKNKNNSCFLNGKDGEPFRSTAQCKNGLNNFLSQNMNSVRRSFLNRNSRQERISYHIENPSFEFDAQNGSGFDDLTSPYSNNGRVPHANDNISGNRCCINDNKEVGGGSGNKCLAKIKNRFLSLTTSMNRRTKVLANDRKNNGVGFSNLGTNTSFSSESHNFCGESRLDNEDVDDRGTTGNHMWAKPVCSVAPTTLCFESAESYFFNGQSPTHEPIKIQDFMAKIKELSADGDIGFAEEFEELRYVGKGQSCIAASLKCNANKNRFTNILPYDHSRVKLLPLMLKQSTDTGQDSDYINSNYIPDGREGNILQITGINKWWGIRDSNILKND